VIDFKDGPLITTVIPTYRRPQLLGRAIKSVLAQTYPSFQVCVYDNDSGDDTPQVVDRLARVDSRVKYFCHTKNIGALKNIICGLDRVETPFFSILSDDDVLLPSFYQTALAGFEEFPEAKLSVLATIQMDDKGRVLGAPLLNWTPGLYRPPEGLLAMLKHRHPEWTSILFRSEVIKTLGPLDAEVGGLCDFDFELRAAARLLLVISLDPGAIFVSHPASGCTTLGVDSFWPGWLKLIRNLVEDEQIPERVRSYAAQVLTDRAKNHFFVNGLRSVVRGNWEDAYKAAEVLRSYYHLKGGPLILRTSITACRNIPLAQNVFRLMPPLRKLFMRIKNRRLQIAYGVKARHLAL
jgi:glycosyltransferase involved in cell wall biosynthesis